MVIQMAIPVLDYAASVPDNTSGGAASVTIPQIPTQLQLSDLGIFIPQVTPDMNTGRVVLSADIGLQERGPIFNNAVQLHIYRDGVEIFNTIVGTQTVNAVPAGAQYFYDVSFSTIDQNVPLGFHVYQLTVSAVISIAAQSTVQVVGPVTLSGLAIP
ncbi:hypothetical protein Q5741_03030 [Paenibacillus sp. JX-17]|uniref:Exosporium protein C n=1 Tax=Paenibacillus lacisoli TaxID=3064525 RepID=A0ABT9CCN7_9BACL|nr:hypothetical protein [Paenibacillus sp. JX-17]MDO7905383.1 hypothetical protein [Paenibacillus sp. JX-17]